MFRHDAALFFIITTPYACLMICRAALLLPLFTLLLPLPICRFFFHAAKGGAQQRVRSARAERARVLCARYDVRWLVLPRHLYNTLMPPLMIIMNRY